jgi:succinoglycan biosynthesis transport protein ExoP
MNQLQQYLFIIRRRWLIATLVFFTAAVATAFHALSLKPRYRASGEMLVTRGDTAIDISNVGVASAVNAPRSLSGSYLNTEMQIMRSKEVIQRALEILERPIAYGEFLGSFSVNVIPGTDVLSFSYTSADPKLAVEAANSMMQAYSENNIERNRAEVRSARMFIEEQLPKAEKDMQQAEQSLRAFREQYNFVSAASESEATINRFRNTEARIEDISVSLAKIDAQSDKLGNLLTGEISSSDQALLRTALSQSPHTASVMSDLQAIKQQIATQLAIYQENSPQIAILRDQERNLEDLLRQRAKQVAGIPQSQPIDIDTLFQTGGLQEGSVQDFYNLDTERVGLVEEVSALNDVYNRYRDRYQELPKLEQEERRLERKVSVAETTYAELLQQLQKVKISEQQNIGNTRILSLAATPIDIVSPRRPRNISLGLLLGLSAAGGAVFLLEAFDKKIKSTTAARELLGFPLLGVIPNFKKVPLFPVATGNRIGRTVPELVVKEAPNSPISEAFRMLQTNLKFLSLKKRLKVIVVTSSVPREGKSTIAANLAATIAELGQRVLLVDADMRHPAQHRIWQISNEKGLSDLLTGRSPLSEVAHHVMPTLEVLPAGGKPANPVALLNSQPTSNLIDYGSSNYDVMIVDTPPMAVAADASILGKIADGIVMLVRVGVADTNNLTFSKELLEQSGQNILGMVVNASLPEDDPYGYYYSYYYNYSSKPGQRQRQEASQADQDQQETINQ